MVAGLVVGACFHLACEFRPLAAGAAVDAPFTRLGGAAEGALGSAGWTALHYASQGQHTDVMELLVEAGADVNAVAPDGWTALRYVVLNEPLSRLLAAAGAVGIGLG